ncbi:MAG: 4a-hydroxytetrahydrobiopterin dehydratase [Patescibacteria group bacterium]|nr:4a-hydroxytetrahydrobiopterin dehydratase [Patescibacteria group bacterium]
MNLSSQKCVPCEVGGEPMKAEEIELYTKDVPTWKISSDQKSISKKFTFRDFKEALAFVNKVGAVAEEQGHHPDITFTYGEATIVFTTHALKGLSPNDFIMAAKVDKIV